MAYIRVRDVLTSAFLGNLHEAYDITASVERNRPGALTFKYPKDGANASLLDRPTAIFSVVDRGIESPDWYCFDDDSVDEADDEIDSTDITVSARGYMALFEYALVYPPEALAGQTGVALNGLSTKITYTNQTPGAIMEDLFLRAIARGCLTGMSYTFTSAVDSSGTAWSPVSAFSVEVGETLLEVLTRLADSQYCEVRFANSPLTHYFDLYTPTSPLVTASLPNVILQHGREVQEAPRRRSRRYLRNTLLSMGDGSTMYEIVDAAAVSSYGRREGLDARGSITTTAGLAAEATNELARLVTLKEPRTITYALEIPEEIGGRIDPAPYPGVDFQLGNRIVWSRGGRAAANTSVEVMGWAISWGSDGARTASVVVEDFLFSSTTRALRRASNLTKGAVNREPVLPSVSLERDEGVTEVRVTTSRMVRTDGAGNVTSGIVLNGSTQMQLFGVLTNSTSNVGAINVGTIIVGAGIATQSYSYGVTYASLICPILGVDSADPVGPSTSTFSTTGFTARRIGTSTGQAWRFSWIAFRT